MTQVNFLKPDNFLGFFKLETGGTIIGAVGLFYALLQFVIQNILFFSLIFVKNFCPQRYFIDDDTVIAHLPKDTQQEIKNVANTAQKGLQNLTQKVQEGLQDITEREYSCTFVSKIPVGIFLFLLITINLISMIAHFRLIKGVEEFDPRKFPMIRGFYLFFVAFRVIVFIASVIWSFWYLKMIYVAIVTLILLVIDLYIYSVIDNLQIKYENNLPLNVATQNFQIKRVPLAEPHVEKIQI